jgi:hypothetical protein
MLLNACNLIKKIEQVQTFVLIYNQSYVTIFINIISKIKYKMINLNVCLVNIQAK